MFHFPLSIIRHSGFRHSLLLLCAAASGAAISASAQNALDPSKASEKELIEAFTRADKDRDKSLSPFEARHLPVVSKEFAKYDGNSDGYMSLPEYMAAMKSAKSSGTMKEKGPTKKK
jgi:Ca2+-binding EF-hand superfamily protein